MIDQRLTGERTLPGVPQENYWFRRHEAAYRYALGLARPPIVDAGCGEGYGTALLSRQGLALGVDLDPGIVARARAAYPEASFVCADVSQLPVASARTVAALQVLEHLHAPARFLGACADALGPQGTLVISTPNRQTFPAGRNPWHVREYDARDLEQLARSRFGAVRILGVRHGALLRGLDRILGESVQWRLIRQSWAELPFWIRRALRAVRAGHFEVHPDANGALDLLAVCRRPRSP